MRIHGKRRITVLVICILLLTGSSLLYSMKVNPVSIEAGYFGETATHPGVTLGLGYKFPVTDWYMVTPLVKIGWYVHPRNHHALFLQAGIQQKVFMNNGLGFELETLAGLLNTRPAGTVYEYVDDGSLVQNSFPWEQKFMASVTGGISWSLDPSFNIPLEPFIKAGAFLEYPFNSLWLPHAVVETGFRF